MFAQFIILHVSLTECACFNEVMDVYFATINANAEHLYMKL